MIAKILGGTTVAAALAAGALFAMLQIAWSKNDLLEQQNAMLERANQENVETIKDLTQFQDDQAKRLQEAGEKREAIEQKTREVSRQLDKLRLDEAQQALSAPFERGNAARDRRQRIFMRLVEPGSGGSQAGSGDSEAEPASEAASSED